MSQVQKTFVIGIDLGGTFIKAALFNLQGKLLKETQVPTMAGEGPEKVVGRMAEAARSLADSAGIPFSQLLGIGVGVPGNHDFKAGRVVYSPNLKWHDVPVRSWLEAQLGVPVFLDNDANAAALGEFWQGAGQGVSHMIMVTLGTGIGGGLILNGRLYRGAGGSAGEIGHTIIMADGPECSCGVNGHLECLAAAPWIVARARAALAEAGPGTESILLGQQANPTQQANLTTEAIFAAMQKGDPIAARVVEETVNYLGMGLANLVNIFNPEIIVLGGGVAEAGEILLQPVTSRVKELALEYPANMVKLVKARLGNRAGCYGAAAIVLQENN